ncbi:MAG: cyclase family protein [Syntrophomonadaceae bacterium]
MPIIDLTHVICPDMPVFPGTKPPALELANTLETDGFIEHRITMYSHTGTHVDAPAHLFQDGPTLDSFDIERFVGKGVRFDFINQNRKEIKVIDLKCLEPLLKQGWEFLLLNTGWSDYWGSSRYFAGFPHLSLDAAQWLTQFNLKGIGIDAISIDPMESTDYAVHKILMKRNILIIENLTNLTLINNEKFLFGVMPLNTRLADGAPVRAFAVTGELCF